MGGDYLYETTRRRITDPTVAYDVAGRVSTVGTRSAGATSNAVMAVYGYDNDLLAIVNTGNAYTYDNAARIDTRTARWTVDIGTQCIATNFAEVGPHVRSNERNG